MTIFQQPKKDPSATDKGAFTKYSPLDHGAWLCHTVEGVKSREPLVSVLGGKEVMDHLRAAVKNRCSVPKVQPHSHKIL